jgi:transposase
LMGTGRETQRREAVRAVERCKGDICLAAKTIKKRKSYVEKWWRQYKANHDVKDQPRSGRPGKLSRAAANQARYLATHRVKNTCNKIADKLSDKALTATQVHHSTVDRALHKGRKSLVFSTQTPAKKLPMAVKEKRLAFCRANRARGWRHVVVLDSKIFPLDNRGLVKEWHYAGTQKKGQGLSEKRKLHAYGAACIHGVVPLKFVTGTTGHKARFCNKKGKLLQGVGHEEFIEVLVDHIIPSAKALFKGKEFSILMDKATAHTAGEVSTRLDKEGVKCIDNWPGNSPDLNWIENLWVIVQSKLSGKCYKSLRVWKAAVEQEWGSISLSVLKRCAGSMRERVRLCIRKKGDHTGY